MDKYSEYDRIVAKNLENVLTMADGHQLCIHNIDLNDEKHLYVISILRMYSELYGEKILARINPIKKYILKKRFNLKVKISFKNCIPYLYNMDDIVGFMVSNAETTEQRLIEIYNEYYK